MALDHGIRSSIFNAVGTRGPEISLPRLKPRMSRLKVLVVAWTFLKT